MLWRVQLVRFVDQSDNWEVVGCVVDNVWSVDDGVCKFNCDWCIGDDIVDSGVGVAVVGSSVCGFVDVCDPFVGVVLLL